MRTLIAALTLILATLAHADGIYKWEDENGVIHYGSQPPTKQQVEVVKKPKSDRYKQWQEEQNALMAQQQMAAGANAKENPEPVQAAETEQEAQQPDTTEAELAARAQRCRSAQQRLQELETHARVREVTADGSYRVLPEEERQQRIERTRQVLQTNC